MPSRVTVPQRRADSSAMLSQVLRRTLPAGSPAEARQCAQTPLALALVGRHELALARLPWLACAAATWPLPLSAPPTSSHGRSIPCLLPRPIDPARAALCHAHPPLATPVGSCLSIPWRSSFEGRKGRRVQGSHGPLNGCSAACRAYGGTKCTMAGAAKT